MSIVSDPPVTERIDPHAKIYLSHKFSDVNCLRNDGLFAKPFIPGIVEGTTYVLRIKSPDASGLKAFIDEYEDN
jgi:hypothetical protein